MQAMTRKTYVPSPLGRSMERNTTAARVATSITPTVTRMAITSARELGRVTAFDPEDPAVHI